MAPHDYRHELQEALSWLGDRYLLAAPQSRRVDERPKYWTAQQHAAAYQSRESSRHMTPVAAGAVGETP